MHKLLALTFVLCLLGSAPAAAQSSGLETDSYRLVEVLIERLSEDAKKIGLTEDQIQNRVELRLRSVGLRPIKLSRPGLLYVRIDVVSSSWGINVQYQRPVTYEVGGRQLSVLAPTWSKGRIGTHSGKAAYLIESLDLLLDKFLNAYLKANQK